MFLWTFFLFVRRFRFLPCVLPVRLRLYEPQWDFLRLLRARAFPLFCAHCVHCSSVYS